MSKFQVWMHNNFIDFEELSLNTYKTSIGKVYVLPYKECLTSVEGEVNLILTYDICERILNQTIDYVAFMFGDDFFYTPTNKITAIKLTPFKYIGLYEGYLPKDTLTHSFLGLHGRYELMNGTRDYKDWCNKATFLQYNTLGICEKNTLAGTLPFQIQCNKAKLKAIIGYTAEVENMDGLRYDLKLYCVEYIGWKNLLAINKIINIDQEGYIEEVQIAELLEGLCVVVSPGTHVNKSMLVAYKRSADKCLFQITTNEFTSDSKDKDALVSMKDYIDHYSEVVDCVLISDAYCLDYEDVHVKDILNKQGNTKFTNSTENHYLRSFEEIVGEFEQLFDPNDERFGQIWNKGLQGIKWITTNCNYQINTKELFLPKYEMTQEEIVEYGTSDRMFEVLIYDGLADKFNEDINGPNGDQAFDELKERIEMERDVITRGGFIDYFLILWDIVNWCRKENIQVGPGRGSAAGCLISYTLGIVKINPLEFGLIFERFLNESRITSELPDIDLDFASDRRDDVIEYMRQRYGSEYVCRVGTYGTLQMRGVIKELARAYNYNGEYNLNFLTSLISSNDDWSHLFQDALTNRALKNFIEDNPDIVYDSNIILNAIKSKGMHACATIIVPKLVDDEGQPLSIYQQIPVRIDDGVLVSEWEGDIMADAGFLKEDILSTKQMAKIGKIFDLVKERINIQLDMEEIPLDDDAVYSLFKQGYNQDVFHFGSVGLTNYLRQVKPDNIDELIACIALYRPGAMASNAHIDYIKLKKGEIEPIYDFQLQGVTQDTYGLYIYQEQIMKAVQVLGDFTLAEADGVRKAMGKKIQSKMDGYKVQFVDKAVEKGCEVSEAEGIWNKMEVFAGYGFNKSHAAAYSVIGYYCNWLKHYYPLEFWTVAFQFADDKKIMNYVNEISKMGNIQIVSPDINKSEFEFRSDADANKIYWNLSSIKFVGAVASQEVINERAKNGKYFSIEEFVERTEGKGVNKRVVENLIIAGCFDEMYKIKTVSDRFVVMNKFYETRKEDIPKQFIDNRSTDHYWSIKQSDVSKLSNLDYTKLLHASIFKSHIKDYVSSEEFIELECGEKKGPVKIIAGMIEEIIVRKTKKDRKEYAVITLQQGDSQSSIRVWPQQLSNEGNDPRLIPLQLLIKNQESRLAIFRGEVKFNSYTNGNEMVLSDRLSGPIVELFR